MIFINSARVIEAEPLTLAEGTETRESELIGQMKDISLDNQRESELVKQSMKNPLQLSWILFEHSQNPKDLYSLETSSDQPVQSDPRDVLISLSPFVEVMKTPQE